MIAIPRVNIKWICPQCKKEHSWWWDYYDNPNLGEKINMRCDYCKAETPMILTWNGFIKSS